MSEFDMAVERRLAFLITHRDMEPAEAESQAVEDVTDCCEMGMNPNEM